MNPIFPLKHKNLSTSVCPLILRQKFYMNENWNCAAVLLIKWLTLSISIAFVHKKFWRCLLCRVKFCKKENTNEIDFKPGITFIIEFPYACWSWQFKLPWSQLKWSYILPFIHIEIHIFDDYGPKTQAIKVYEYTHSRLWCTLSSISAAAQHFPGPHVSSWQ